MTRTWTKITKVTGTSWTKRPKPTSSGGINAGSPIGLLLALTYAATTGTLWTKMSKPSGTSWTKIAKAV